MQLEIILNKDTLQYISSNQLYDTIVSMPLRYMPTLSFDMKNEQIYKIIKISRHSVSLQIIGYSNFEPKPDILIEDFST